VSYVNGRGVREIRAGHAAQLELVLVPDVGLCAAAFQRHRPAGGVELSELRDGAPEPDFGCRGVGVDKAEWDKPTLELAVVDHQMGDGTSARVDDQAADFAADPIAAADVSPDRERRHSSHGRAPRSWDFSS